MKKSIALIALAGSIFSFEKAEAFCVMPEVKAAYFHPTNSRFQDIYSGSGLYSLDINFSLCWDFYGWVGAGYFRKSGRSIGEETKTTLQMVPLTVGAKYMFCINCFHPYLGAGFLAEWMKTNNDSPFVIRKVSKWGFGGIFKVGTLTYLTECIFLDLFVDYSYMKIDFHHSPSSLNLIRHKADLSGFSFGGGIGWQF